LALFDGGDGRECRGEGIKERVALSVDLDTPMSPEDFPQHPLVLFESLRIPLGAQLVQQPRLPLDIREQEGDRAARKLVMHAPRSSAWKDRPSTPLAPIYRNRRMRHQNALGRC
jgi:hypothetical protein